MTMTLPGPRELSSPDPKPMPVCILLGKDSAATGQWLLVDWAGKYSCSCGSEAMTWDYGRSIGCKAEAGHGMRFTDAVKDELFARAAFFEIMARSMFL